MYSFIQQPTQQWIDNIILSHVLQKQVMRGRRFKITGVVLGRRLKINWL
jgi:hypothetical protein